MRPPPGRKIAPGTASILAVESTQFELPRVEQVARLAIESSDDMLAALGPVLALKQHHKVVAADMPDEILGRVAMAGDEFRCQLDHLVAAPVAVEIVVGLEVEIAGRERNPRVEQANDMFAERNIESVGNRAIFPELRTFSTADGSAGAGAAAGRPMKYPCA